MRLSVGLLIDTEENEKKAAQFIKQNSNFNLIQLPPLQYLQSEFEIINPNSYGTVYKHW
jgi:hypothetical protein